MPTVCFTSALKRFLPTPSASVDGATVGAALGAVFASQPALRGYVLDDQGAVRRHVVVFINGQPIKDRGQLTYPVAPRSEIYLFRALPVPHTTQKPFHAP